MRTKKVHWPAEIEIQIKRSGNKQFYFVIVHQNKEVLATSETHKNNKDVEKTVKGIIDSIQGDWVHVVDETAKVQKEKK